MKENLIVWAIYKKMTDEEGYTFYEMEDIYSCPEYIQKDQGCLYKVTLKNSKEMGFDTLAMFQNLKKHVENEIHAYYLYLDQLFGSGKNEDTVEKYFWENKDTLRKCQNEKRLDELFGDIHSS